VLSRVARFCGTFKPVWNYAYDAGLSIAFEGPAVALWSKEEIGTCGPQRVRCIEKGCSIGTETKLSKGRIAIMRKVVLLAVVFALAGNVAYPQSQRAQSTRQIQVGEVVPFGESVVVRVVKSSQTFAGVKVTGEPVVVVLELDSGKPGASLFYKLSADPAATEIFLLSGAKKLAPRAVIEDFPSWGDDNDKEVEVLDPKDMGGTTLNFQRKGSIALLFDVPPEDAKIQKKLSVVLRIVQPKDEQHSFVVTL
jgi:hypothetical protein